MLAMMKQAVEDIRIVGTIDMTNGKILRWAGDVDSTSFEAAKFAKFKTPQDKFPSTFKEAEAGDNASPKIRDVATRFHQALAAGDAKALGAMLSYDAVYEDMALHTELLGRPAIEAYLGRALAEAPFGSGGKAPCPVPWHARDLRGCARSRDRVRIPRRY